MYVSSTNIFGINAGASGQKAREWKKLYLTAGVLPFGLSCYKPHFYPKLFFQLPQNNGSLLERVSITSLLFWYFSKIFSLIDCPIFFGWFLFFKMNNMGKWTHFYTQLNLELSLPLPNKKGEERRVNFLGLADTKGQWGTLR